MSALAPVAVLGAGSWGTVLAELLAEGGAEVRLWARREEFARSLQACRENERYVPGLMLPDQVRVTSDLASALAGVQLVVVAVPAAGVPELARRLATAGLTAPVLSATKGFEPETLATMTDVLARELGEGVPLAALSGPNLSKEIAAGQPAAAVVASADEALARAVQAAFPALRLRVYRSHDVLGLELAGALKNVLALAAGMLAELGFGANSQAALLTRGLAEITRLGVAMGGDPRTFQGLAGMGDVLATCSSPLSRNFRGGRMAARGLGPDQIRAAIGQAVEGLATARLADELARRHGVEMPLAEEVARDLDEGQPAREAVEDLMTRPPKSERDESARAEA